MKRPELGQIKVHVVHTVGIQGEQGERLPEPKSDTLSHAFCGRLLQTTASFGVAAINELLPPGYATELAAHDDGANEF
jgi:hypothetical protein